MVCLDRGFGGWWGRGYAGRVDIVFAAIAVAAFATVLFLAVSAAVRAAVRPRAADIRVVADASGEGWLTVEETAELLEVSPARILELVERAAIPFYVLSVNRSAQQGYRFRRDEIEAWTIG